MVLPQKQEQKKQLQRVLAPKRQKQKPQQKQRQQQKKRRRRQKQKPSLLQRRRKSNSQFNVIYILADTCIQKYLCIQVIRNETVLHTYFYWYGTNLCVMGEGRFDSIGTSFFVIN
ncbi:MAG: hypothetical protein CV080_05010 [Candidatus Kuenenia stuttgartiensis]|nr:MAG: hypothetical protein CV080_05010 [Candidatus Kuenenia stuttgartiensis]